MKNTESIANIYQQQFGWIPKGLELEHAHFNVFDISSLIDKELSTTPFKRRDFYKITLLYGKDVVLNYADKTVEIDGHALVFSNPLIPYGWEGLEHVETGHYCIFNQAFFHRFGQLSDYPIYQAGGIHVFPLNETMYHQAESIFLRMKEELHSNYRYKYDVLRGYIFDLLHFAMKMHPDISKERPAGNAAERITHIMFELLERQLPIDELHRSVQLHSPSDFAQQLNIHVNHLNRSVKEVTGKTTGEVIAERFLLEAKRLLQHSPLSISEISYALGFSEPTRFNAFFKRHTNLAPTAFRKK